MKIGTEITHVAGRRVRCRVLPPTPPSLAATPLHYPLLLIHGLGCSADIWERTLRSLAGYHLPYGAIAPDLPGFGRSAAPKAALDIEALADWAAELLDTLEITRVHLAGNSMGCQVALAFARRHPHRVGALVLVGPTLGGGSVSAWRYALGLLADAPREIVVYRGMILRMYLQMGVRRFLETIPLMIADDTLAHARAVQAPCLVLRGGGDAIIPDASARQLAAALANGAFAKIAGSAHAVQFNRPESFAQVAVAFLLGTEERHEE